MTLFANPVLADPVVCEPATLLQAYQRVRRFSERLAEALSPEDAAMQSMTSASPTKWHLAHTTWFFETFVLRDFVDGYRPHHADYAYLFNSYYEAEGQRHARPLRGMLTRPTLAEVLAYRIAVNRAVEAALPALPQRARDLIALGCYDVFNERGLRCPEDISVVGFNDMPFLDKLRPPLTSVSIPHHQIGVEAARMLLESIEEPERPTRSVLLPLTMSVRGSTAPPPA